MFEKYIITFIFTAILSLRDINIYGFGIYFFEFLFSIVFLAYSIVFKKQILIPNVFRIIFILLVLMVFYDAIYYDNKLGNFGIILGAQVNLLFSIALITFITMYKISERVSISKSIFLGILIFNSVYFIKEAIYGPGAIDLVHVIPGDIERYRFLYAEPSYGYVPIFCAGLFVMGTLRSYFKKSIIFILILIAMIYNGSKNFYITALLSLVIYLMINFKKLNVRIIFIIISLVILVIIYSVNNEKIYYGFIDPLLKSDINIVQSLLSNSDNINVGSFQTRFISILSGIIVFWNSHMLGVGPQLEAIEIGNILHQNNWFNPELLDAYENNPMALTSKSYFFSLLTSFGIIAFILFFRQIYISYHNAYSNINKFIILFIMTASFITEGVNFFALLVLIYYGEYENEKKNICLRGDI